MSASNSINCHVLCLSEAISPISHMSGSAGNESIVAREDVVTDLGVVRVPFISGNAIRHRCVREPGWRWLIEEWGLCGKLTLAQLNWCLHGGNLTEGGGRENLRRIADMQRLLPLARLLGGSLPDQIIAGSLLAWRGRLVCEENRQRLAADLAHVGWSLDSRRLRSAESFVSDARYGQYTRSDASKTANDLLSSGQAESGSNLMIFSGQTVAQGAAFVHGFTLQHVSQLELGALVWSLRLWQSAGGTIGGSSSRGHGRLRTSIYVEADEEEAVAAYIEHCSFVRNEAVQWLNECFVAKSERASRKTKKQEVAE